MQRRPAEEEPEVLCRWLGMLRVFRDRIETLLLKLLGVEFDLARRRAEFRLFVRGNVRRGFVGLDDDTFPLQFGKVDPTRLTAFGQVLLAILPGEILRQAKLATKFPGDPPGRLGLPE